MHWNRRIRLSVAALAAVALTVIAVPGRADAALDTDSVRLLDNEVDFGGSVWDPIFDNPVGGGTLTWDVVDGFYTPRLVGTLHLHDASGKYARMHVSYWGGGGDLIETRHGGIVHVANGDNGHHHWSVDLSPLNQSQIVEAHVCTEISSDGVDFSQVDCQEEILD